MPSYAKDVKWRTWTQLGIENVPKFAQLIIIKNKCRKNQKTKYINKGNKYNYYNLKQITNNRRRFEPDHSQYYI